MLGRKMNKPNGLNALNATRAVKIIGDIEVPKIALITAQEKKINLFRLIDAFKYVETIPSTLAKTTLWDCNGIKVCSLVSDVGGPSMD